MGLAEPGHWEGAFEAYTHFCVQSSSPFSVCHHGNMLQPQAPITMDAAAMTDGAAMTDITDRNSREVSLRGVLSCWRPEDKFKFNSMSMEFSSDLIEQMEYKILSPSLHVSDYISYL